MPKEEIKVLLLAVSPAMVGGIAQWTKHILNYYEKNNDGSVELISLLVIRYKTIRPDSPLLFRLFYGIKDYFLYINNVHKKIKTIRSSVVHLTSSASWSLLKDIIIQRLCIRTKTKNIIHFHFGRIPELCKKNNWEWKLICYVIKQSTTTIVIDKASFDVLLSLGFSNIKLIPNPISPDILKLIEKSNDINREPRKVVFAGHIIPTKGVFELVKACVKIENIQLVMLGKILNDDIKKSLLHIAKEKGSSNWMKLDGNQPEEIVIREMLSAGVFVLPSYTEGFPNVILESMACGCVIIATPVGAIPEMLNFQDESNVCGICVNLQDVDGLKEAIECTLNNKSSFLKYGERAKIKVNEEYSMPAIWGQLIEVWKQ